MRRLALAFGLALLAAPALAAGCPDAAKGFERSGSAVGFGYYIPSEPVTAGNFALGHMHVGGDDEFAAFAKGERMAEYAPIMLEFEDTAAGRVETELGDGPARTVRVLPDAYCLVGDQIRFSGKAEGIGAVGFTGTIAGSGVVVAGALTVAGKTFDPVQLDHSSGD